jgi:hypothetical protein
MASRKLVMGFPFCVPLGRHLAVVQRLVARGIPQKAVWPASEKAMDDETDILADYKYVTAGYGNNSRTYQCKQSDAGRRRWWLDDQQKSLVPTTARDRAVVELSL